MCLGVITGAHGIQGEVKLLSFTENPLDINAYGALVTQDEQAFVFTKVRPTPKHLIAKIKQINDRNGAEALRGTYLYVVREQLPTLAQDEVYLVDLVGLPAMYADGSTAGVVTEVFTTAANTVLTIRTETGEMLVPYTDEMVAETMPGKAVTLTLAARQFENL